jgi:hypothetical protein
MVNMISSNAMAIFKFGHLYLDDRIKRAAFQIIQRMFPEGTIGSELIQFPDKLEAMVTASCTRKRKVAAANQEYENAMKKLKETV